MKNFFTPERLDGEDWEHYKARRKTANAAAKQVKMGVKPTRFNQRGPGIWPMGQQEALREREENIG